jgi:hypothetical protein
LTIDWIDDSSTIRQSVDTFENVEDAQKELKVFDEEVNGWVKNNHPDWKREGYGISFLEYGKPGGYYTSHAVAKITMCVVK